VGVRIMETDGAMCRGQAVLTTMRCEMVSFPAFKVVREKQRDVVGLVGWFGQEREGGG